MKYLILQNPGHNRVYYTQSQGMALAELALCLKNMDVICGEPALKLIAGVQYYLFEATELMSEQDIRQIASLSFVFALFEFDEQKELLRPLTLPEGSYIDRKIGSILKYQGKTNELFTRMMLNMALLSTPFSKEERIQVLDPLAGRGTTLFEAAAYGFDAYGIEIDSKATHETSIFFKKYMEEERYKHRFEDKMVTGTSKRDAVYMREFCFARDKDAFKDETQQRSIGIVNGNTTEADRYFKRKSFHLIVGDLPYGIFHGNSSGQKGDGKSRNPGELIEKSLQAWVQLLKPGGAIALSWNTNVLRRGKLIGLMEGAGLAVKKEAPYDGLEHRVDQAIQRDVLIATCL